MRVVRRLSATLTVLGALVGLGAGVAAAKMSYWSVEVSPMAPRPGDPISVVVRLWNDQDHSVPADWAPPEEVMDGLLSFLSGDQEVPVDLALATDGGYRGTVMLPSGSWTLVPFPETGGLDESVPGYPAPITITVAPAPSPILPIGIGLAAAAALVAAASRLRRSALRAGASARLA